MVIGLIIGLRITTDQQRPEQTGVRRCETIRTGETTTRAKKKQNARGDSSAGFRCYWKLISKVNISHDFRRILHFNVTKHPTNLWIVQQLLEAFPFASAPRFLIFDRDAKYGLEVPVAVRSRVDLKL